MAMAAGDPISTLRNRWRRFLPFRRALGCHHRSGTPPGIPPRHGTVAAGRHGVVLVGSNYCNAVATVDGVFLTDHNTEGADLSGTDTDQLFHHDVGISTDLLFHRHVGIITDL